MTAKKANGWESSESGYIFAYFGGRVEFDASQTTGILGGGNKFTPTLDQSFPRASRIEVTFTPQGPRVDGSAGMPVIANVPIGDSGKWTFNQRGIFPGVYTTTARVITRWPRATTP